MTELPRVNFEEIDVGEEQLMFWKGQAFTGIAVEFFPDGTLRSEEYHLNGLRHGPSREWYRSGQRKEEMTLWYGGLHGYKREWNEQGRLISEVLGELGIGIAEKRWDEQGRLIMDWHIGPKDSLYEILLIKRKKWGQSAPPLPEANLLP
ncbi:MAG: toxin-antitoxin system YwqK family antitoxin [Hyalangium sp.]|uniref:toxin-antitoxin system YwqK family antitoxin n=1 Tax=Hyalangium sp. TaxID=2028555 RepID=UPI003899BB21